MAATFGERLKELRDAAKLSQGKLAELAGVRQSAISQWESGARDPGWAEVMKLCSALGVSCEAFRPTEEEPPKKARKPKSS